MVYVIINPTSPASTLFQMSKAATDTRAVENIRRLPRNSRRTASHLLIVMAGIKQAWLRSIRASLLAMKREVWLNP